MQTLHRADSLQRKGANACSNGTAMRFSEALLNALDVRAPLRRLFIGGSLGNEQLTAAVGCVLVVLLAAEGATLLNLRSLLNVHAFVGMLLIPVVALKLASTGDAWCAITFARGIRASRSSASRIARARVARDRVSTLMLFGTGCRRPTGCRTMRRGTSGSTRTRCRPRATTRSSCGASPLAGAWSGSHADSEHARGHGQEQHGQRPDQGELTAYW